MKNNLKILIIIMLFTAFLIFTNSLLANPLNEYLLVKAEYPIFINNSIYQEDLPLLNYQGFTYVPLRAVSELLNVQIDWNEGLRRVEISRGSNLPENTIFRNIIVNGSNGEYTVIGEAKIFEATLHYEVEDGHIIYLEGFESAEKGAPEWGLFRINIHVAQEDLPINGTLMLNLFEISAKDGSRINELPILLETLIP